MYDCTYNHSKLYLFSEFLDLYKNPIVLYKTDILWDSMTTRLISCKLPYFEIKNTFLIFLILNELLYTFCYRIY